MKVLVVGAGAIGMLLGAYLSGHNQLTFITRRAEQALELSLKGCSCTDIHGKEMTYFPHVLQWETYKGQEEFDLVLITTKQNHLDELLPYLERHISKNVPLLFLLNGMGHVQRIASSLTHATIYTGITQCAAIKSTDRSVEEKGRSFTKVGPLQQTLEDNRIVQQDIDFQKKDLKAGAQQEIHGLQWHPAILHLQKQFSIEKLEFILTEDIEFDMLKKCMANACINPLSALFQVTNGELVNNERLRQMMGQLYQEIIQLLGCAVPEWYRRLDTEVDMWQEIVGICRITSRNHSSMLQDMKNQRKTEIDAITGYFLSLAKLHNVPMPYHEFIFNSIHFKEEQYDAKR